MADERMFRFTKSYMEHEIIRGVKASGVKRIRLHDIFDEALARYIEKQNRSDRRIDDYYEKICSGNQEKPFHEIILQIGN